MIRIHSTSHAFKAMYVEINEAWGNDLVFSGINYGGAALRNFPGHLKNFPALHRNIQRSMQMLPWIYERASFD